MAEEFFANSAATGANDGSSEADAWDDISVAVSGMASGAMTDSRTLNQISLFTEAARIDITGYSGNSPTNFIRYLGTGGFGSADRDDAPADWEVTASQETVLMRENDVIMDSFRIFNDTQTGQAGIRVFTSTSDNFLAKRLYVENANLINNQNNRVCIFQDCIFDLPASVNAEHQASTTGNEPTTTYVNCTHNDHRLTDRDFHILEMVNCVYQNSTDIFKATNGQFDAWNSAFEGAATALDTDVNNGKSLGDNLSSWFTDHVNGDFSLTATGLSEIGKTGTDAAGLGPSASFPATEGSILTPSMNGVTRSGATAELGSWAEPAAPSGGVVWSLAHKGGLAGPSGLAGPGGGLAA